MSPSDRSPHFAEVWEPRVLVVDDDELCRLAAVGLLQSLGLTVDIASDGQQALEMSAGWPYLAIFMDCSMPELDGYAATRQLAAQEGIARHTPVVAMTTHSRSVCMAAGMDHHIAKPLTRDKLRADCLALGLVARRAPAAATGLPVELTPLLRPPLGASAAEPAKVTEATMVFVERAATRLPELCRAVNAGDLRTLERVAGELKERAATLGAARIADLCDRLRRAAGRGDGGPAAELELALRAAVAETAQALAAQSRQEAGPAGAPGDPASQGAGDPAGGAGQAQPGPAAPVRVAIADDDPLARLAIEGMLEQSGRFALVGVAADVEEIIDLARFRRPDVVLLDWMMPGGGGAEAARQILAQSPDTRIVALSSFDTSDVVSEMARAGASEFIVKGCSGAQLAVAISSAVSEG